MTQTEKDTIRRRVIHCLNPDLARAAGMTFDQLLQTPIGAFVPSDEQFKKLGNWLQISTSPLGSP